MLSLKFDFCWFARVCWCAGGYSSCILHSKATSWRGSEPGDSFRATCSGVLAWEREQPENIGKTHKEDQKRTKDIWLCTDRWHDRHESIIDICEYHRIAQNAETYPFAHGNIFISEPIFQECEGLRNKICAVQTCPFCLLLSDPSIRWLDRTEMQRTWKNLWKHVGSED